MYSDFQSHLQTELSDIREAGLYKNERVIVSPQGALIRVGDGKEVLNFCANNYLGLSNNPELISAAKNALDSTDMAFRRYVLFVERRICTNNLKHRLHAFSVLRIQYYMQPVSMPMGRVEPLLNEQDAIISDALNHASIIDGVRLCKAQRYRMLMPTWTIWKNSLLQSGTALSPDCDRWVFSMDGNVAPLDKITNWPINTMPWLWSMSRIRQVWLEIPVVV
jgi:glycine C-acetyltransferase